MLVKERMSSPVISVDPNMPIMEALKLMQDKSIRRTPVLEKGKLLGIVSDKDLLNAAPSDATTLSVWEMNYLLGQVKVKDVMTKNVLTVTEDTPIEEAAYAMVQNKIGGMPVMRNNQVVGLITETDLFKIFLELMGAQDEGVRVTALVPERPGELDELTHAIAQAGGSFVAFGQFSGDSPANRMVTFKVAGMELEDVKQTITPHIETLIDIRICC
ncbi:MAG: CBS domain-containing protein [Ardenticatenaceae bacterium]|nr:CBS domain-containing protein [Anaerolineales bacterium]MCB8923538.1 CBS domain-containing protein [Ardenticatenaceae bacterium]MCB8991891.1 CBS domain-containing protein [Ardenticatenaceae bacterium]MCB9003737.1 CBS domain-containing protein [Ardenticatenaceae bacterium]